MNKKQEMALAEMPQTGFHFNEEVHLYVLDGKPLTGVTTILQVIAKPALIQWSADECAKFMGWFNGNYDDGTGMAKLEERLAAVKILAPEAYLAELASARVAHAKKKEAAGDTGHDVHAEIEKIVKASMESMTGRIPTSLVASIEDKAVRNLVANFVNWSIENDVTFLESEKRLYSREHWYAGTTDVLYMKNGRKYIGDIKTSSAVYPEMFMQMAGYQIALEEQGERDIFGSTIIRCGKDGTFEAQDGFDDVKAKRGFLAALELYRVINS